ncbi:MAG: nucleotidyltransferase family protein, partial [Christensenellales bacterium]
MKTTAIIAEYNPFHNGHLYQLSKAKSETNCDALVVVMSGSFTQRGDICIADKYTRANWAIAAGADIVIELPVVYSLSPANR